MKNPVAMAATLPPSEECVIPATWGEVWAGFESYLEHPLGTHVHIHKFSNGTEVEARAVRFRKMVFLLYKCHRAPITSRGELLRHTKEVEAWTNQLFEVEESAAGIDSSKARTLTRLPGVFLYEPTDALTTTTGGSND
jgi:hypothetical protein